MGIPRDGIPIHIGIPILIHVSYVAVVVATNTDVLCEVLTICALRCLERKRATPAQASRTVVLSW